MKKLIAVILAALMCASMLLACGGGGTTTVAPTSGSQQGTTEGTKDSGTTAPTTEDVPPAETYNAVFIMYVANDNWAHMDQVRAAIKDLTTKELNIAVDAIPMTFGSVGQQLPLMLSGNEQVDVLNQFAPIDYYEQGFILDMMPYWDKLQGVIEVFGEDEVRASLRDGKLLGFYPRMERTHRYGMAMRTDILEEAGYDPATINDQGVDKAYEVADEIFAKVHELHPELNVMGGTYSSAPPANTQHTDALNDGYGVLDNYGDSFTVTNYYESDYFKSSCEWMKKWYDAGYIAKDMPTCNDGYETLVRGGSAFGGCCPMKPDSDREKEDQCNHKMTIFYWREDMITAYTGAGYAIGGTSKDPEQAARLMNYIFTSREFNDLINWGVEGVDWVENPDEPNQAMYPEGMTAENQTYHNSYGWAYPNQRIAHVWINNEPNMYTEIYPNAELTSHKTKAYGFIFDNTPYIDQVGSFNNIRDQYIYGTTCGAGTKATVDENIDLINKELYAAGLQDYMDAKQAELDAWVAANGK